MLPINSPTGAEGSTAEGSILGGQSVPFVVIRCPSGSVTCVVLQFCVLPVPNAAIPTAVIVSVLPDVKSIPVSSPGRPWFALTTKLEVFVFGCSVCAKAALENIVKGSDIITSNTHMIAMGSHRLIANSNILFLSFP
jgi:hypothetical protein